MTADALRNMDNERRGLCLLRIGDSSFRRSNWPNQSHHGNAFRLVLHAISRASHDAAVDLKIGKAVHKDFGHGEEFYESFVPHGCPPSFSDMCRSAHTLNLRVF